jgi:hypothetical protein
MHHLKKEKNFCFIKENLLPGLKLNGSIGPGKVHFGFGFGKIVIENVITRNARAIVKHRTPFCKTFNPLGPCKKQ